MSDVQTALPATRVMSTKRVERSDSKKLRASSLGLEGEYAYARYSATLPVGWTVEDALQPEFWSGVINKFKSDPTTGRRDLAGSIVILRSADHAFYAELYVRAVEDASLLVHLIREPIYFGPKEVKSNSFETRWNVGKLGYDVIRNSDRQVVASGLKTKEAAQDWIDKTTRS